jgi:hypothetical protein
MKHAGRSGRGLPGFTADAATRRLNSRIASGEDGMIFPESRKAETPASLKVRSGIAYGPQVSIYSHQQKLVPLSFTVVRSRAQRADQDFLDFG